MVIVVMQPGYLPWLGFFELIYRSDIFVIYDNVQYDKNSWRNRNRIKTPQGALWLTVPVRSGGRLKISEVLIDNSQNWRKSHSQALKINYSKSAFFEQYFDIIQDVLSNDWSNLLELDLSLIDNLLKILNLNRKIELASKLGLTEDGNKVERLIRICKKLGADKFYEPAGGKTYLSIQRQRFQDNGIELIFQDFKCPEYPQLYGEFLPDLSVVDLLFNVGAEKGLKIVIEGGSRGMGDV